MEKLDTKSIIESWPWRLKKAKVQQKDFAPMVGLDESRLSLFFGGKATPSLETFELIENKLKDFGV